MTGGASNLTLRLVMSRNKLENVSLGVRIDNLVEDSIILPLDWAKKVGSETSGTQPCMCIIS